MHTIEKKKISPVIIPVTQFRSWERRKLHFSRVQFYKFPGGGGHAPGPPEEFVPEARTVLVRQLNHCIR